MINCKNFVVAGTCDPRWSKWSEIIAWYVMANFQLSKPLGTNCYVHEWIYEYLNNYFNLYVCMPGNSSLVNSREALLRYAILSQNTPIFMVLHSCSKLSNGQNCRVRGNATEWVTRVNVCQTKTSSSEMPWLR